MMPPSKVAVWYGSDTAQYKQGFIILRLHPQRFAEKEYSFTALTLIIRMGGRLPALDVGARDWDRIVAQSEGPVAVEFWAPWCPWCLKLMPEFDALSAEYEGRLRMLKLNSEDNPDIAQRYGVMGLPTIKMFCQGRPIGEVIGYMPKPRLKAEIDRLIQNHKECLQSSSPMRK